MLVINMKLQDVYVIDRYKDFNHIDFTFPYEAVDRMNDWLRDAKHFYSHPNKDVVLKGTNFVIRIL